MKIDEFLKKHSLRAVDVDANSVLSFFKKEMTNGLEGKESSLKMIPTYLSTDCQIKPNESVIVLDAGGTNFRTCLVTFDNGKKPIISDFKKTSMPGIDRQVSASEFFSILADNVERLINKSDKIGFCFSYAAEITTDHDGIPLLFSKEIKAPEVIGMKLGTSLFNELKRRGYNMEGKKISIVNDTVATLLAAKAACPEDASSYIGFILGTGTNTAYVERDSKIKKLNLKDDDKQIINIESGNLKLSLGDLDQEFLDTTENNQIYFFEKKISGAYLGAFTHLVINKAIEEGVFSSSFASRFKKIDKLNTTRMSNYLELPNNKAYDLVSCVQDDEEDANSLYSLIKSIIERAGKLTALNITAAVLESGCGKDARYPVVINADGTTFYKTEFLEFYTKEYLDLILNKEYSRHYKVIKVDDSPTIGAAIAALI